MAKKVIILESSIDRTSFRVAYWADVPVARQTFYADPLKTSAWKGASAGENLNIANGLIAESVQTHSFPSNPTFAVIQTELAAQWQKWQAHIDTHNPWSRYGTFFDNGVWTPGGVA